MPQQNIVSAAISGKTGLVKQLLHKVNVNIRDDLVWLDGSICLCKHDYPILRNLL